MNHSDKKLRWKRPIRTSSPSSCKYRTLPDDFYVKHFTAQEFVFPSVPLHIDICLHVFTTTTSCSAENTINISFSLPDLCSSRETFGPMSTGNIKHILLLHNFKYNGLSLLSRITEDVQTVHVFNSSTKSKQREMLGYSEV